jgi:hypothetical protein
VRLQALKGGITDLAMQLCGGMPDPTFANRSKAGPSSQAVATSAAAEEKKGRKGKNGSAAAAAAPTSKAKLTSSRAQAGHAPPKANDDDMDRDESLPSASAVEASAAEQGTALS